MPCLFEESTTKVLCIVKVSLKDHGNRHGCRHGCISKKEHQFMDNIKSVFRGKTTLFQASRLRNAQAKPRVCLCVACSRNGRQKSCVSYRLAERIMGIVMGVFMGVFRKGTPIHGKHEICSPRRNGLIPGFTFT